MTTPVEQRMVEVLDAEVVEEDENTESRALVHAPRRHEVLRPLDLADQKAAMDIYQQGLRTILDSSDWQDAGRGERFVKKSGWRKIAAWFDLSIELVRDEVERDEEGSIKRASVWARAVAASGRFADGDGYCDSAESRFARSSGRQKLENDLRGTATTRAINRAISNLVGMGAVSAEEIDSAPSPQIDTRHPYGPAYTKETAKDAGAACVKLAGGDPLKGIALWKLIEQDSGAYMPEVVARALIRAANPDDLAPDVAAPEVQ